MFEQFPYANFHEMNMDWVIKVVKDFLDKYEYIEELINTGKTDIVNLTNEELQALTDKKNELEALLQAWYDSHSADIAQQLADAISTFNTAADDKAAQTIASIPADYTTLSNNVVGLMSTTDAMNGDADTVGLTKSTRATNIVGATAVYDSENDCLKIYGTATSVRRYVCLNGQNIVASTSTAFSRTLPAGVYKVHISCTGNIANVAARVRLAYTTSTFGNNYRDVFDGDVINTPAPIMVGLHVASSTDYGTEENPSTVSIKITQYTAKASETAVEDVYTYYNHGIHETRNIFNAREIVSSGGYNIYRFDPVLPAGTYTFSADIRSTSPNDYSMCRVTSSTAYADEIYSQNLIHNRGRRSFSFTSEVPVGALFVLSAASVSDSAGYSVEVVQPQIEIGNTATAYVPLLAAVDDRLLVIEPTGDNTDRSKDIIIGLSTYGEVKLAKGNFYVSGFRMPDNTKLTGCGAESKVILSSTSNGTAITLGNKCTVSDVDIVGSLEDITRDGIFAGTSLDVSSLPNLWADGDQTVSESGFRHILLTTPLPAGVYLVTADVSTDNPVGNVSAIVFSDSQTTSFGPSNIIDTAFLPRTSGASVLVELDRTAYSVRLTSANNVASSSGYGATFTNISVQQEPSRCGIAWKPIKPYDKNSTNNEDYFYGFLSNCRIYSFNCAGILMMNSGTPTNRNLHVSNCSVHNCNVGLYFRKDSEFNKIVNCTFTGNYYGMLNRAGNNVITNCGFDSNIVGMQYDEHEGNNSGHGSISNCTINHSNSNNGYGIIIKDTGRMLISNCNLYFSKVKLEGTNGNVFSGCGFGNNSGLEIIGGQCSLFIGCMMRDASSFPITPPVNNTASKMINCYYRNGDAVVYPPVNNETNQQE